MYKWRAEKQLSQLSFRTSFEMQSNTSAMDRAGKSSLEQPFQAAPSIWRCRAPGPRFDSSVGSVRRVGENHQSAWALRSEEHKSELQSPVHLVCRLLLEKKKKLGRDGGSERRRKQKPISGATTQ